MHNTIKRACSILLVIAILLADCGIISKATGSDEFDNSVIKSGSFEVDDFSKLGRPLFNDTLFTHSLNGMVRYNRSGQSTVTLDKVTRNASCPTSSDYMIRIISSGVTDPGLGGFYQAVDSHPGSVFYHVIIANIPVGYSIGFASNFIGYKGKQTWLTSTQGTGDWQTYIYKTASGLAYTDYQWGYSFGYVYLKGAAATEQNPLTWYVAYANVFDATGTKTFVDSFDEADDHIAMYNNYNNGATTVEKVAVGEGCPTKNTYMYKISTLGTALPGLGGFSQRRSPVAGRTYYHKILAKVPVGYRLEQYHNAISGEFEWVTDNSGTGEWEAYVYRLTVDKHAQNLYDFGYIALVPDDFEGELYYQCTTESIVTWYLGYSNIFEAYDADYAAREFVPIASRESGSHVYIMYRNDATWTEANRFCALLGGHLATVTSAAEKDLITSLQTEKSIESCWLGASDASQEGQWRWVTGEAFSYSFWGSGQPDNSGGVEHYLESWGTGSSWNDDNNNQTNSGFVCEFERWYIPAKTIEYNGHIYSLYNDPLNWSEAKTVCESMGGHLVTITDDKEQEIVETLLHYKSPHLRVSIGASDAAQEGVWTWVTGERFDYTNWDADEPNNYQGNQNYAMVYSRSASRPEGKWDDNDGSTLSCFICEVETAGINPAAQVYHNGNCYVRYDKPLSWYNAREFARMIGGHLVTITSQQEQNVINGLISDGAYNNYWLGAKGDWSNAVHRFTWITGEGNTYNNWGAGEPSRHNYAEYFATLKKDTLLWNDVPNQCADYGFVVEIENAQGTHGNDISWQYNGSKLIINGTGDISDFESLADARWYKCVRSISVDENNKTFNSTTFNNTAWYRKKPEGMVCLGKNLYAYKGEMSDNTHLSIGRGITAITHGALANQPGLYAVTIPATVNYIASNAFDGCCNLTELDVNAANASFSSYGNAIFSANGAVLVYCPESFNGVFEIPVGITAIAPDAFSGCTGLTGVTMPEGLRSIGENAFAGCTALTEISIPDTVTQIGDGAFGGCAAVTIVGLPSGIDEIGSRVFADCASLTEIDIGKNIEQISATAFENTPIELIRGYYGSCAAEFAQSAGIEFVADTSVLTLDANGGEAAQSSLTVITDCPLTQLPDAQKENSSFVGWFTSPQGGEQVAQGSMICEDTTVYAVWEERSIESISVSKLPDKTVYSIGETVDTSGMELTVNYSFGDPQIITDGFVCSPKRILGIGERTITVNYEGFTAQFTVTAASVVPVSLEIVSLPAKQTYYVGDSLDTKGLQLAVNYSNATQSSIRSLGSVDCTYDFSETGSSTVQLSYIEGGVELTAQFTVSVLSACAVSSQDITAQAGETIAVPLNISNNTGIMGAFFRLSFDEEALIPDCVLQGELLSNGSFDYNSIPGTDRTDIVWTGTSEIAQDGELCTAYFTVADSAKGDYTVNITYLQGDTFNEHYEDVKLVCENVTVTVENDTYVEPASIYIDSVSAEQGSSFDVPVNIANNPGFGVASFTLSYDSAVLTPTAVTGNTAVVLGTNLDSCSGSLTVILNSLPISAGDGTLFTVSFEANGNAPGESEISMSCSAAIACRGAAVTVTDTGSDLPARVYSDDIFTKTSLIDVPIYVEDNSGLMGFRLTLDYDSELITPVSVRQGALLTGGSMVDSIDSAAPGSFDIVWSNSAEIKGDGELAVVSFEIHCEDMTQLQIGIDYSESDTFNEDWEDVSLICSPINISTVAVSSVAVYTIAQKTHYFVGESFDPEGLQLLITYADGSTEVVDDGYSYDTGAFTQTGTQPVEITLMDEAVLLEVTVDRLVITAKGHIIYLDAQLQLTPSYLISDELPEAVSWVSDNPIAAQVDANGLITANSCGNAVITATDSHGNTAQFSIQTVSRDITIRIHNNSDRSFSKKVEWWKRYSSVTMQLRYTASLCPKSVRFVWTSDNPKVRVDQDGNITNEGVFARSARITVTAYDYAGNVLAKTSVRVSFYKFDWQSGRLSSQAFVSDDYSARRDAISPVINIISVFFKYFKSSFNAAQ